ncbi:MAG TPA: FAD-dependent oxidoreductase [Polyangiaceae bacterium]
MRHTDVIVAGAGAAGLSAARQLARAGARVALLEAGPRPGGRILTEHARSWRQPIELGAEFVHETTDALVSLASDAELTLEAIPARHFAFTRHALEPAPAFDAIEEILAKAENFKENGTALDLLTDLGVDAGTARWFTHFVEGFHAAPIDRISARSIAKQGMPQGTQYRLREGYGALVEYLERDARLHGATIAYGTLVREVRVHADGVEVASEHETWSGTAVIVALPLSILRTRPAQGGIAFDPEPAEFRSALARFEMGHALRVVLRFREPLELHARLPEGAFLHVPGAQLPTFWVGAHPDQPQLTAWCGGPRAERWSSVTEPVSGAIASLSQALGTSQSEIGRLVLGAHVHDFGHDPYVRGAYPYEVPVRAASRGLPDGPPLLFAGDYVDGSALGTVGAALESGHAAARRLLAAA